jgi:chitinase
MGLGMTPEEQAQAAAIADFTPTAEPRRRLSWVRMLGVIVVLGAVGATLVGFRPGAGTPVAAKPSSSFAPYVDVTAIPQFGFEDPTQSGSTNLVLGFVVSTPSVACQPSWGGAYSLAAAASGMDLDRRIARLRQRGGQVAVSFGGAANSELSIGCVDVDRLTTAYQSVVDRYSINTIDLDIEGAATTPAVAQRRAAAIGRVQRSELAAGRPLTVWLTLPVSPVGLTDAGKAALDAMLAAHVTLAGVNALTMDFGESGSPGQTMASLSESALTALADQLGVAYATAGTSLSSADRWGRIGATAMIGQNDTVNERFELSDARALLAFARSHHLRQLSMWSVNRDQTCGPNYANTEVVSVSCSGIKQDPAAFTDLFTAFTGQGPATTATLSPSVPSAPLAPSAGSIADDPATSPYPIWDPVQSYPKGSKAVWHHNVYKAKWFTQGDTPDAPVAQAAETPWSLIGPVLPGEIPAPMPTLSVGTYPQWSPTHTYVAGDRAQYEGIGYQAKWWTTGDQPGGAVANPSDTPWQPLGPALAESSTPGARGSG